MNIIPRPALDQHVIVLGKTGSGKSSAMRLLVEQLLDEGKPVCIIDPKGDWYGLRSDASGKGPGFPVVIFGGPHADLAIDEHSGAAIAEIVATGNRPCIIDLGDWMVGQRTRFFIEFAQTLFRHARGARYLVIDECHNFVPQGKVLNPDAGKMLHWGNRLASEGRGKGITLIAASQRPQKVHKDFLTSAETLIAMRVIHPLDRGAISDWIDGCADRTLGAGEVVRTLAQMPRGEAWVWSPEIGFGPQRVKFPKFRTFDSFQPQTVTEMDRSGWADVNMEGIRAKLADVVKHAVDNDPERLRAQMRDLETSVQVRIRELEARAQAQELGAREIVTAATQIVIDEVQQAVAHVAAAAIAKALAKIVDQKAGFLPAGLAGAKAGNTAGDTAGALLVAAQTVFKSPSRHRAVTDEPASITKLPKAERKILTALAQYPSGRSRGQVAALAGYAKSGGNFNNAISALRTSGRIGGHDENLCITIKGKQTLGSFTPLPHGWELVEYWSGKLGKAEREVLKYLHSIYPRSQTKNAVAEVTGYAANGGNFNNALSRLRVLELIEGTQHLTAGKVFFT